MAADLGPKVAVVALGGYGRQVLTPGSDVDLMVLHRERRSDRVRETAERLFYPFWDAGIPLGHSVRSVDECLSQAKGDLHVTCSLLDARLLEGEPSLLEAASSGVVSRLRRNARGFAARLGEDALERHLRHASCATALEPNLKEGRGGLRDLNAVRWLRLVDASDAPEPHLDEAEELLVRVRSALHLHTGRKGDVLHKEHQPELASLLGFDATAGLDAPDVLMRTLFDHGRRVASALDGAVDGPAPEPPDELRRAVDAGWSPMAFGAFVDLLAAGEEGARVLQEMDLQGDLVRLLPAWEAVRCRPQRDPYHRSPVDEHLLATAGIAADILNGRDSDDDPALQRSIEAVGDPAALLVGALLHDIGKRGEGSHVAVGRGVAEETLGRMGVDERLRDDVVFLVGEHLLLPNTATRRDLADHDLVLDVAARVGDPRRLAMLHVLSVADARATGPHAATPWRFGLVRELVARIGHVLEAGEMDRERAAELDERRETIRALLRDSDPPAVVDSLLEHLPRPYLLAVPPETVADHRSVLWPPPGRAEVRTVARPGERAGVWRLTVVAADRPGLLARIAGSLALTGLSILSAQAFTTGDGVAIDLFDVTLAFEGDVDEERWRAVRHTLRRALEGRLSLEYRVREKRALYPPPAADVPTEVRVLNDASDFATVVEVETADRIGLLFDLARAFEEMHLDVSLAKVATYGPRVVDAFYVRDQDGAKLDDPEVVREIERAIRARLS